MRKPTIPEVRARFQRYHKDNPSWGSLHIVLDDGNVSDGNVEYAIRWAQEEGDTEGEALGRILLTMSPTQRSKMGIIFPWPVPEADLREAACEPESAG